MAIELKDDAGPFFVNEAFSIPYTDSLNEYVVKGIIIPITKASDWTTSLVVTRRADNSYAFVYTIQY